MNETGTQIEQELVWRRLSDAFPLFGREVDPQWWWALIIPIMATALVLVVMMYIKDARRVGAPWALALGLCRTTVYGLLLYMFLLPARQYWEKSEKKSRVIVAFDVSDSMKTVDDPFSSSNPSSRLQKVLDYLNDDSAAFLKKLLDKNPVLVYRFASRLDDEAQTFEAVDPRGDEATPATGREYLPFQRMVARPNGTSDKEFGAAWKIEDWKAFAGYDFRQFLFRGLSADGIAKLKSHLSLSDDKPVDLKMARELATRTPDELTPAEMSPDDGPALRAMLSKLKGRVELVESLSNATNVPESLLNLVNREAGNLVQGIIIFSDGQSNQGSDTSVAELRTRAKREGIPIFTVAVGEDRKVVNVRIADVQAPDQTTPNDPFKIFANIEAEGLVGQTLPITLELTAPQREVPFTITKPVKIAPGEPPGGQVEFEIKPSELPEDLRTKASNFKEFIEGEWKVVTKTPRVKDERFPEKEHKSEAITVKIIKKPIRVLLFASAPTRDFQFLMNQLIRDKADISIVIQNDGGMKGPISLLDDPNRILSRFPDKLNVGDDSGVDEKEKWYNLAKYDTVIAFDPDWAQLKEEQLKMIQTWVELNAGGLLYIAGPFYTRKLAVAQRGENEPLRPIVDIMPVIPGDLVLSMLKHTGKEPYRLKFEGINPESDFLKLDDDKGEDPLAGWEQFFTGKEKFTDNARLLRGFYSFYPVEVVKPGANVLARYTSPDARGKDGKDAPYIVQTRVGQGMTIFVGSGEIWRLRQYKEVYFERFWTKMARYAASFSQRKQDRRGRILMSSEFTNGNYIRITAQLLNAELKPVEKSYEPKATLIPFELDQYQTKDKDKENLKYRKQFTLAPQSGPGEWGGFFVRQVLAAPETYPPGQWRLEVEIPDSRETLKHRFIIRQSNPETDNTRVNYEGLVELAGDVNEIATRIQPGTLSKLNEVAARGTDGTKLAFRFDKKETLDVIPDCMIAETKSLRNRGALIDQWDKGIEFKFNNIIPWNPSSAPSWWNTPFTLSWVLMTVVTLLSLEWITRKLLRLA
jgi:hypothetical protein